MTATDLLSRLHKVRRNGKGWLACCPAHADRTPSLSIHEGDDGRVLLHCFAGCETDAICTALGIEVRDLMPDSEHRHDLPPIPPPNSIPPQKVESNEWADLRPLTPDEARTLSKSYNVSVDALREMHKRGILRAGQAKGAPIWVITDARRINRQDRRFDGEPIETKSGPAGKRTQGKGNWPIGLGGAKDFDRWLITEGNTDLLAGFELLHRENNLSAWGVCTFLGSSNAKNPHPDVIEALRGKSVTVGFDNDTAGNEAAAALYSRIKDTAAKVERLKLPGGCDLRDMIAERRPAEIIDFKTAAKEAALRYLHELKAQGQTVISESDARRIEALVGLRAIRTKEEIL